MLRYEQHALVRAAPSKSERHVRRAVGLASRRCASSLAGTLKAAPTRIRKQAPRRAPDMHPEERAGLWRIDAQTYDKAITSHQLHSLSIEEIQLQPLAVVRPCVYPMAAVPTRKLCRTPSEFEGSHARLCAAARLHVYTHSSTRCADAFRRWLRRRRHQKLREATKVALRGSS